MHVASSVVEVVNETCEDCFNLPFSFIVFVNSSNKWSQNVSQMQVLAEITQTWSIMSLSYESHSSTGTPLLKADENLIETLEDNQVTQTKNVLRPCAWRLIGKVV